MNGSGNSNVRFSYFLDIYFELCYDSFMSLQQPCRNPLCENTGTAASRYCGKGCEHKLTARRHNHRKRGVINKMKMGDEKWAKRRAAWRRVIITTRINEGRIDKKLLNTGIQFGLEWALNVHPFEDDEPQDAFYIEWLLNSGTHGGDRECLVREALQAGIQVPDVEERDDA